MEYLKLARWPHWWPGLFSLTGIFYARKLFDPAYFVISLWFFIPFLLAGIGAELISTALATRQADAALRKSLGEAELSLQFDWRVQCVVAGGLFVVALLLSNLLTKGLHTSAWIIGMGVFAVIYGAALRKVWMADVLLFPLFYLIPTVAGTLDTLLPLYAAQIVVIYLFGVAMVSTRFACADGADKTTVAIAGLAWLFLMFALAYHVLDQAERIGRMSLLVIPISLYAIAVVVRGLIGFGYDGNRFPVGRHFLALMWNQRTKLCAAAIWVSMIFAVHWKL